MNTAPFEVIPLTEASYAEFRNELNRIIARPETAFLMVEDEQETVVRSVLGMMKSPNAEPTIGELSQYEMHVLYRAVRDASDDLPFAGDVAEIRMDRRHYTELVARYGLGTDALAAFSGADTPRVLSSAAGPDLLSEPAPDDVVGYLVIEHDED